MRYRKLKLNRDTIRTLNTAALAGVAGGVTQLPGACAPQSLLKTCSPVTVGGSISLCETQLSQCFPMCW